MDCKMNDVGPVIAMASFPWQKWKDVMDAGCALEKGTIFEELVLPFCGTGAACDPNFTRANRSYRQEKQCYNNDMRRNNMGRGCGCR